MGAVEDGDLVVSLGTSGTLFCPSEKPIMDVEGRIAPFCDSTGELFVCSKGFGHCYVAYPHRDYLLCFGGSFHNINMHLQGLFRMEEPLNCGITLSCFAKRVRLTREFSEERGTPDTLVRQFSTSTST